MDAWRTTGSKKGLYSPQIMISRPLVRRRWLTKVFKSLLVVVLLVTICINVMFIMDTAGRLKEEALLSGKKKAKNSFLAKI
jgi:hypothetical protein